MQSVIESIRAQGSSVLGISTDSPEENAKVVEALDLSFPVLADPELKAIDAFGVRHPNGMMGRDIARPAVFLIGAQGTILWSAITDNWRVRVRPEEVLAALEGP